MSQDVLTTETNRRQLQQIIAGLSDGVILLDPDQSILWANEAALAMHGVSQVSDLGANAEAYAKRFALRHNNNHGVPADSYPINRVARGETFSDVLVEVSSAADEERTWVHRVRSLVLTDSHGKPQLLVLIMDDVTDRVSAEQRFATAFRLSPVPILLCGAADQRVLDVNEAFLDTLGYPSEEVLGISIAQIDFIDDKNARIWLFAALEKSGSLDRIDVRVRRKDAGLIDCTVSADTVNIQDNPCYLLVLVDITERRRTELELVSAIEEAMKDASWFSRTLIEKLSRVKNVNSPKLPSVSFTDLTARERDVLGLICEGRADKEIAARLKLAPNTVRNHVAAVYLKLNVHSRSEAIVWAREWGLFSKEWRPKGQR
ncbi:PAS domain S-box protein [Pseudomonas sp. GV085]|uniref:PAS domain S-box protein n=1 Tax=Pseudomonas sp. GV085 TaxID=2135756 RepID=UPI000D3360B1|nr:PAS domain S-box protein [Pseudomonas sp. GV085]PTR28266.1 PAS domain S-box-containing protein [Pseudomonas sp. GV085]